MWLTVEADGWTLRAPSHDHHTWTVTNEEIGTRRIALRPVLVPTAAWLSQQMTAVGVPPETVERLVMLRTCHLDDCSNLVDRVALKLDADGAWALFVCGPCSDLLSTRGVPSRTAARMS